MSKREFRVRYVFGASTRETQLAMCLAMLSGTCLAAVGAEIPGIPNVETAKVLAGLTVPELLALITLASLGLAGYCMRSMLAQGREATRALTKIASHMEGMKCLGQIQKKQEALSE